MAHEVQLADGVAVDLGEGVFIITQASDQGPQSVVVTMDDILRLLEAG